MSELIAAVKAKDKAKVERLLEGGADPNENGAGGKDQVSACGQLGFISGVDFHTKLIKDRQNTSATPSALAKSC